MRETENKKVQLLNDKIDQKTKFQMASFLIIVNFIIQELKFCKHDWLFFVSVSLKKENLREFFFLQNPILSMYPALFKELGCTRPRFIRFISSS